MKRALFILAVIVIPGWIFAQQAPAGLSATLKITNMHVEINGQKVEWDETYAIPLTDGVLAEVILFEKEGIKYGSQFTYKRGTNRLKLVRRGFAVQTGKETKFGKKEKDMQVMRTSIPGNLEKRVVENIITSKQDLQAVNVSYNYELIYK